MDYARNRLADALAAEYVMGTLRFGARRRFESLLAGHPGLRAAVHDWQDRLLPLMAGMPPVAPPATVWRDIELQLWPAADAAAAQPAGWWQRLGLWRGVSATASAAVLALAVLLVQTPSAAPPIIVVLEGQAGTAAAGAAFVASVGGDGRSLVMQPVLRQSVAARLAAGHALELWSLPPQGAPRSMGLVSETGVTVLDRQRLPDDLLRGGTAALAVSVEPPGGSPTGAPTGPVVFVGELRL